MSVLLSFLGELEAQTDGPQVVMKILREMAREAGDTPGLRYSAFKSRIEAEKLLPGQAQPLKMRLQLLESFLATQDQNQNNGQQKQKFKARKQPPVWKFDPGSLTIVDLSCPFVAENDACALFNICLSLFLEDRSSNGRIIALDEAHKVSGPNIVQLFFKAY